MQIQSLGTTKAYFNSVDNDRVGAVIHCDFPDDAYVKEVATGR